MAQTQATLEVDQPNLALGGRLILPGLSVGHVAFHWIVQSFAVVLSEIQQSFQLNSVGVSGVMSARELAAGLIALPGGIVADVLRRWWGPLLAGCLVTCALDRWSWEFLRCTGCC